MTDILLINLIEYISKVFLNKSKAKLAAVRIFSATLLEQFGLFPAVLFVVVYLQLFIRQYYHINETLIKVELSTIFGCFLMQKGKRE